MRCGIAEDDPQDSAPREAPRDARRASARPGGAALRRASARAPARARRARVARPAGPVRRLAPLLRAPGRHVPDRARFEDLQWADAWLLDFLEYLLEWSRNHPLFVLTLARPELADRRPDLGRRAAQLHVALPRAALRAGDGELLAGLVPGLPKASARRSSPARRASPCTRSRPCACCSTAALLVQEGTSTGRSARSRRSRCPRRCTR